MSRETIAELNQKLVQHGVESVISYLVGSNNYENQTRTIGMAAYTGGKGHSFQVVKNGTDAGFWYENNASDAPNGQSTGDLVELWSLIKGISKGDTCKEIRDFLNIGPSYGLSNLSLVKQTPIKEKQRLAKKISVLKPSSELSIDKLEKRLHANEKALSFLFDRSLNELTVRHFRLGLSQPYKKKDSDIVQQNALVVPIINKDGKYCTPNAFYNVPGVTENPINDNGWRGGGVNLCYNTTQKESHEWMIVTEGMKDLWALHQIIAGTDLEHRIIISSTHGSSLPIEVDNPMVFSGLVKVFLGHDADPSGNKIAEDWAYKVGNKAYRLKPPFLFDKKDDDKDWTDFLKNGGTAKKLFALLNDAHPIRTTGINKASNLKDIKPGKTYSYSPVDISGAYINGNLYYPIVALESGVDSSTGVMGYSRVVKVVRNDKKIYDYYTMPLLKRPGALATPIYALSDGTIISDIPKIPPNASWKWEDIEA